MKVVVIQWSQKVAIATERISQIVLEIPQPEFIRIEPLYRKRR